MAVIALLGLLTDVNGEAMLEDRLVGLNTGLLVTCSACEGLDNRCVDGVSGTGGF